MGGDRREQARVQAGTGRGHDARGAGRWREFVVGTDDQQRVEGGECTRVYAKAECARRQLRNGLALARTNEARLVAQISEAAGKSGDESARQPGRAA